MIVDGKAGSAEKTIRIRRASVVIPDQRIEGEYLGCHGERILGNRLADRPARIARRQMLRTECQRTAAACHGRDSRVGQPGDELRFQATRNGSGTGRSRSAASSAAIASITSAVTLRSQPSESFATTSTSAPSVRFAGQTARRRPAS
jgi:hypothetical protein